MQGRQFNPCIAQLFRENLHAFFFSMHEKSCFRITRVRMPRQQFRLVSVRRKTANGVNSRTHRDVLAKDTYPFRAVDDLAGQRALRRIPDKHDAVAPIPQIMFQVMTHPSASAHARTRHNDGAATDLVNRDGLGSLAGEMQPRQVKRI